MTNARLIQIQCILKQKKPNKAPKLTLIGRKHLGKGETGSYKHFLLFPLCFLKRSSFMVMKNQGLYGKGLRDICW